MKNKTSICSETVSLSISAGYRKTEWSCRDLHYVRVHLWCRLVGLERLTAKMVCVEALPERISAELHPVCCQHFCFCIIYPLYFQCTNRAVKGRKWLPMYIHTQGFEFMYIEILHLFIVHPIIKLPVNSFFFYTVSHWQSLPASLADCASTHLFQSYWRFSCTLCVLSRHPRYPLAVCSWSAKPSL